MYLVCFILSILSLINLIFAVETQQSHVKTKGQIARERLEEKARNARDGIKRGAHNAGQFISQKAHQAREGAVHAGHRAKTGVVDAGRNVKGFFNPDRSLQDPEQSPESQEPLEPDEEETRL